MVGKWSKGRAESRFSMPRLRIRCFSCTFNAAATMTGPIVPSLMSTPVSRKGIKQVLNDRCRNNTSDKVDTGPPDGSPGPSTPHRHRFGVQTSSYGLSSPGSGAPVETKPSLSQLDRIASSCQATAMLCHFARAPVAECVGGMDRLGQRMPIKWGGNDTAVVWRNRNFTHKVREEPKRKGGRQPRCHPPRMDF